MAKKLWERVQEDIEKNRQTSEQIRINANNQFNENIRQNGKFDTNKHTTSMSNLLRLQKDISKEHYNSFKKSNGITLWDTVKQTANDIGNATENTWLGFQNGMKNFQQTLGKRITETLAERSDFWDKQEKQMLENRMKQKPEEKKEIQKYIGNMDNQLGSGKRIREEGEKTAQEIQAEKEQNINKISENIETTNSALVKKFAELSPSIGQMAPSFIPGVGVIYATGSAAGQYYDDAKQRGMSEDEANVYSGIMGALEGTTEMIGVKNLSKAGKTVKTLVKGAGKEVVKEGIEEVGKVSIKTALKEYGIGIADNIMQEALIEPIQETVASSVGGKDKANWENMGQRMLQSGIDGGLVATITGGAKLGIDSCVGIVEKSRNGKTITQEELKVAVQDASKEIDTEKMIIDSVQQQVDRYKDYNTNKLLDSVSQEWLNRANNIINENNTTNLEQNGINNEINSKTGQINQAENKMSQNGNMEQIEGTQPNIIEKDSNGNSLTENQKKFFKNSNVKDENGNLQLVWHFTNASNNFDTFDYNKSGTYSKDTGKQLKLAFFSKNPGVIEDVLPNTKLTIDENGEYFYNDENISDYINGFKSDEFKIDNIKFTPYYLNYSKIVNELTDKQVESFEKFAKEKYPSYFEDFEADEVQDGFFMPRETEAFVEWAKENGYEGMRVSENEYGDLENYAIWGNPNNIKKKTDKLDSNLANNQQTVYNNTESEGGIDGQSQFTNQEEISKQYEQSNRQNRIIQQNDKRRVQELFEEYERGETDGTSNSKELLGNQATKKITEQEVKKTLIDYANKYSKTELNENEIKLKNIINNLGGNVVFYEYGNNNIFEGLADKNTFYIDTLGESKIDNIFYHELTHYLRQNNNKIYINEIQPIVNEIASDYDYQEAIFNYANSSGEYFDVRKLDGSLQIELAEEVVADQIASIYGDLEADYGIDSKIKERLKASMDKVLIFNENIQKQTNTTNQLNKVEENTQSLGYKPDTEGKQRKHYKSVMKSNQVGEVGKQSAKSLLESDTYRPLSNIDTLANANENIQRNGVEDTYIAFRSKLNSNERITLRDIAIGERLIQIFSQGGDINKVNDLIQDVAILGTELGQMTQAMSLIKKASPEGQLMYLNKMVDRLNLKENADLKVSEDMSKRILETKNETELENVMTDIAVELGSQLPVNIGDKVRAWRYLSMLGNPKTHIKNLGANVAMNVTQQTKNKVAGAMEDVVGIFNKDMERTKTLRPANSDQRSFAKQDAEFMKDKIDGGGKYDIKNAIQSNKKQFDNKALNAIANFNSDMLELEDNIFLKKAYQQAMQNYMSANKLSSNDMQNASVLQKAREYASYQAQEATFHQFSELAQRLTEIENKGAIAGKTLEAVVPFKKTPINIAKSGIEYSPIGLAKSLTYDIVQLNKKTKDYKVKLEKGFISEAEYKTGASKLVTKTIDNMAKGLTGTSLALLGYALKDMGILKSGNDGEDDEFKEKLGEQEYAIRIGDSTYTLDWVSPSAIPMFIGATVHDLTHSEKEDNSNTLNLLMTSSAKALEPMTEMSMLQGLTSAISSYEQGSSNMLFDLGASAVSSYLGQFVPTALGQVARTIDDKERDTSSTEKGLAKKVEQFKKQQMAKIPIVSMVLPARKDVWGNEKTRDSNVLRRAYEVGLAPYNRKKVVEDYTEKELLKVFKDTGERSVLPGIPNKDITIDKKKYRLTAGEYNKAKESFGKTSKGMLDSLVKSKEYKSLTDEQKAEAINNIYSYAKEKIKVDYAKGKKEEIETTPFYNVLKELRSPSNQSEYLSYSSKIKGIEKDKEKKQILSDGNYSLTTKAVIYKNTLGKEDELYNNVLGKDNVNINEYLKYTLQEFESDKKDDGTKKGKTISGSKKKKVLTYVDNMKITNVQKLAILGTQYKLNREGQQELFHYLDKLTMKSYEERLDVFSKYSSNFIIYEDDTMDFK